MEDMLPPLIILFMYFVATAANQLEEPMVELSVEKWGEMALRDFVLSTY